MQNVMQSNLNNFNQRVQYEIQNGNRVRSEISDIKAQLNNITHAPPILSQYGGNEGMQNFQQSTPIFQQAQASQLLPRLLNLEERFNASQQNLRSLSQELGKLSSRLNELDQYYRRNNLIVHGLTDVPILPAKPTIADIRKFISYVVKKLNDLFPNLENPITADQIDDTHV